MKRPSTLVLVIAINLIALLALVFIYPHLMVSPGPLSAGHAELATDCFACHAPWRGAAAARCTECHVPADIGLRTTLGVARPQQGLKTAFHQELQEQDCLACHSDHAGPRLTQPSRKPFSHALLRPAARERCDSCHKAPADALHRQVAGNCSQCHSSSAWEPATFEHDKLFLLDRDHNATCVTCHKGNDYKRYTCFGCHEHTPGNVRAEHEEEGIRNFDNCVECHRSADEDAAKRPGKSGGKSGRKREHD